LRDDFPARLFARALAGLTDLALVQYWASEGGEPTIEPIPDLVLPAGARRPRPLLCASARPLMEADLDHRCGDCGRRLLNLIYGRRVARAPRPILRSWPRHRACFVDGSEEPVEHIIVVRGARPASIWDYARRRDAYAAAGLTG
jgi:hypothetical protein